MVAQRRYRNATEESVSRAVPGCVVWCLSRVGPQAAKDRSGGTGKGGGSGKSGRATDDRKRSGYQGRGWPAK